MEQGFNEIPEHLKLTGDRETNEKIIKLFFMACYDLDKFRDFLKNNPFFYEEMNLNEEILDRIWYDDVQLMKFGFKLLSSGPNRLKDLLTGRLNWYKYLIAGLPDFWHRDTEVIIYAKFLIKMIPKDKIKK